MDRDFSGSNSGLTTITHCQEITEILTPAGEKDRNSSDLGNKRIMRSPKQSSVSLHPNDVHNHNNTSLEPTLGTGGNLTPPGLGILCAVIVQLSARAELRRWTLFGSSCAEAVRTAPAEEGAFGRIYRLRDGPGSALALKIFKSFQGQGVRSSAGNEITASAGSLSDTGRLSALVELFHLLRCRDLEQASSVLRTLILIYF